jgi:anti-sigma factor RsiW
MVTCRELVELVTDYLDGALPPARRAEVVAHLEECADCLRYLAQLQATRQVLRATTTPRLSPEDRAAALAAFQAWCAAEHASPGDVRRPWWRRLVPGRRGDDSRDLS